LQATKQRSSKLFFIVEMFENMYGGKNIKYKSFDFIFVHVIWYTLGHSTLDMYCICNVIYIGYQIRKITYKWLIFCEFWQKYILLPPLPCHEVALIDKSKHINILLQKEYIVGLVGMGGIGKTTMSKKFYHLFHNQYDKSSFLEDVKSNNINDVIKQLIYDLCGKRLRKDEDINKEDLDKIKQCMTSKKMLVVVDDIYTKVEELTSLQFLIDKGAKIATSQSRVLMNCWNWQTLKSHVKVDGKVVMKPLEDKQAKEIFMFHAFNNANHVATKDFENICMKIIKSCGGLPLSLKVLGSFCAILKN